MEKETGLVKFKKLSTEKLDAIKGGKKKTSLNDIILGFKGIFRGTI